MTEKQSVYPKHQYSNEVLLMALEAANERAQRWEERCLNQKVVDAQFKEILKRLDEMAGTE